MAVRDRQPTVKLLTGDQPRDLALEPEHQRYVVGRSSLADLQLDDPRVSREHAEFVCLRGAWYFNDLGSRNGSFADGKRVSGPVLLRDGISIRCGGSRLSIEWVGNHDRRLGSSQPATVDVEPPPALTGTDRELLREMCRGVDSAEAVRSGRHALPSNADIADSLQLGEDAIRQRLKRLYPKFQLRGSDAQKRRELVARVIETGAMEEAS